MADVEDREYTEYGPPKLVGEQHSGDRKRWVVRCTCNRYNAITEPQMDGLEPITCQYCDYNEMHRIPVRQRG